MKSKDFNLDGVNYEVKKVDSPGCKGCAFEESSDYRVRMTACKICMYRINTIYIEKSK